VRKYGWDKQLPASTGATGQYDARGVMGSGSWYGIPSYVEYVMLYFNKDLFARNNIPLPQSFDDLTRAMDAFAAKGITPLANGGAEYMAQQYLYQLALTKADRNWVNAYQRYSGKVDFHDPAWTYGMNTFVDWVNKGYIAKTSAGLKSEDAGTSFEQQRSPMMLSGSWWFGRFEKEVKFDWDTMPFPGAALHPGSSGNIWVVPKKTKNAALAEEFINITMQKQAQNSLGNNGGIPVAADASAITDPKSQELIKNFQTISDSDGLAYYPDWPSAGFYDTLVTETQKLMNGSATVDQVQTDLQKAYDSGIPKS
jgi:raffinose/stachyose/melibiose transport system substrate-binding protein